MRTTTLNHEPSVRIQLLELLTARARRWTDEDGSTEDFKEKVKDAQEEKVEHDGS